MTSPAAATTRSTPSKNPTPCSALRRPALHGARQPPAPPLQRPPHLIFSPRCFSHCPRHRPPASLAVPIATCCLLGPPPPLPHPGTPAHSSAGNASAAAKRKPGSTTCSRPAAAAALTQPPPPFQTSSHSRTPAPSSRANRTSPSSTPRHGKCAVPSPSPPPQPPRGPPEYSDAHRSTLTQPLQQLC